ncbi:MAG TPA: hypothetical protein VFV66_17125 [Nonomuraea sp.]|nr:hypothetical protein [Nonomuraea sp.]
MGETKPPDWWPGLQAERDGVTYNAQKIANIAEELREAMKPIGGEGGYGTTQGSVGDLTASGNLSALRAQLEPFDRIEGIKTFVNTLADSHGTFTTVYGNVLENFRTAIALIDAGASTYHVTTTANEGGS